MLWCVAQSSRAGLKPLSLLEVTMLHIWRNDSPLAEAPQPNRLVKLENIHFEKFGIAAWHSERM